MFESPELHIPLSASDIRERMLPVVEYVTLWIMEKHRLSRCAAALFSAGFTLFCGTGVAQTWTPVNTGSGNNIYTAYFVNADTGWVGGEGSLIRKTTNGGATWTNQTGNRNITSIHFINTSTGWAVGGSGGVGTILRTTNGGTTWTIVANSGIPVLWSVQFLDSLRGWAVGASGSIRKSTNGGGTWTSQTSGTTVELRDHYFKDTLNGWAVGLSGTLLRTTDGGASWVAQVSGTTQELQDIFFLGNDTGWCSGGNGTLLRTVNGGASWAPQNTGVTATLFGVFFVSDSVGYAAGTGGTLIKTSDGGATWTPQATSTTNNFLSIQFVNNHSGWITGGAGTVLKSSSPAPAGLAYPLNPAIYSVGISGAANIPSVGGTAPFTFSVIPDLPAGLSLNPSTGAITGTPVAAAPSSAHVVTATNSHGSTAVILNVEVRNPPSGLGYSYMSAQYSVGTAIPPNIPSVTGTIASYSVSPALPSGLVLNATTGVISGTPTAFSPSGNYTVTADNGGGGATSATLEITVLVKPANLTYIQNTAVYPIDVPITPNAPSLQGSSPITYSVNPPLPAGLSLNGQTGIITGTPGVVAPQASYTVTASNAVGSTTRALTLTVQDPSAILTAHGGRNFNVRITGTPGLSFRAPESAVSARIRIAAPDGGKLWEASGALAGGFAWDGRASGRRVPAGVHVAIVHWLDADGNVLGASSLPFTLLH